MFIDTLFNRHNLYFFEGEGGTGGGATEVKDPAKPNLNAVIKEAVESVAVKTGDEIKESESKETKETPEVKDTKESKDIKETSKESKTDDDLTTEQKDFRDKLYKGLASPDPKVALGTLKILANAAGFDLNEIKTVKAAEVAEESILDLLKQGLGEFDFLAEKFAPALEKVLDKVIEKRTKDIRDTQKATEQARVKADIDAQLASAFSEYENSAELVKDVESLMDQYRPTQKTSAKEYFKSLIILAANSKGVTLKLAGQKGKENTERIDKNRKDAISRLASDKTAEVKDVTRSPSERRTLKQSVRDAVEQAAELINTGKK